LFFYILQRYKKTEEEVITELANILYQYALYDHAERVQNKINAKNLSYLTDWKHLVKNYITAHNMALHAEQQSLPP